MKVLSSILLVLISAPSQLQAFIVQPLQHQRYSAVSRSSSSSSFLQSSKTTESTNGSTETETVNDSNNDSNNNNSNNNDDGYNLDPAFRSAYNKAEQGLRAANIPTKELLDPLLHFTKEYIAANQASYQKTANEMASAPKAVANILEAIQLGIQYGTGDSKFLFGSSHTAMRGRKETTNEKNNDKSDNNDIDYDFYQFGTDFFRPVVDADRTVVLGKHNLQQAMAFLKQGENVVFLANHQSEADPQVMSICLEDQDIEGGPALAEQLVYVAGHKVTTDPLAIPFSMGRNLICIHSKKHMDAEPELKSQKQRDNLAAMGGMLRLLKNGSTSTTTSTTDNDTTKHSGCALWVAPSGGRDRRNLETGQVPPAPFDQKTIDMFRLMGNKSKVKTHFFVLAMVTYDLCPPPDTTEAGVGEQRNVRFGPVGIHCGAELSSEGGLEKRHEFAEAAMADCIAKYEELVEVMATKK